MTDPLHTEPIHLRLRPVPGMNKDRFLALCQLNRLALGRICRPYLGVNF